MDTKIMLWVVIGVMFIAAMYLIFSAGAVSSAEKVQIATSATKTAASAYGGMVGGC